MMKAILMCGKRAEDLPFSECPEALVPYCNIPLLVHILRYLDRNSFTEVILLHADARTRQLAGSLLLQIPIYCRETFTVTDAPTLVLRRLCLPEWDMGELLTLGEHPPVRLLTSDGDPTHAELHGVGSSLQIPEQTATVVFSKFHRAETAEEYLALQAMLAPSMERFCVGAGLLQGKETFVDRTTVIGTDCVLGNHVVIEHSCIGNGVQIGAGVTLRNCIVGDHAVLDRDVQLDGACVPPSAVMASHDTISMQWRADRTDGICKGLPRWNTPITAVHAGAAMTALGNRIAVGFAEPEGAVYADLAANGAASQGTMVWRAGACAMSQLLYLGQRTGCSGVLWISGTSVMKMIPYSGNGIPLTDSQRQRILQALQAKTGKRVLHPGCVQHGESLIELWKTECRQLLPDTPFRISISCGNPTLRRAAGDLFPASEGERITLNLSEDGMTATAFSLDTGMVQHEQLVLLSLLSLREMGEALAVPAAFHPAAEQFASKYGGRIMRMYTETQSPAAAKLYLRQGIFMDGVRLFAHVLRGLHHRHLTFAQAVQLLPPMYTARRQIATTLGRREVEHLQRTTPDPSVQLLLPDRSRLLELLVHSETMEAASELCGFWEKRLRRRESELESPPECAETDRKAF